MTVCVLRDSERLECSYQISSIIGQGGVDPGYKGCGCVQDLIQRGRQDRHIHVAVMSKIVCICKLLVFLGIIFITVSVPVKKTSQEIYSWNKTITGVSHIHVTHVNKLRGNTIILLINTQQEIEYLNAVSVFETSNILYNRF